MVEKSCQRLFNVKMMLSWDVESLPRVHQRRWGLEMREREMKKLEKLDSKTSEPGECYGNLEAILWEPENQWHSEKMICSAFHDYGSASRNSAASQKYFLKCICVQHVHHSSCPCSRKSGAEHLLVQCVHCVSCYNLPQDGCSKGKEVTANTAQFPLRNLKISRFLYSHSILEPNLMNTMEQL